RSRIATALPPLAEPSDVPLQPPTGSAIVVGGHPPLDRLPIPAPALAHHDGRLGEVWIRVDDLTCSLVRYAEHLRHLRDTDQFLGGHRLMIGLNSCESQQLSLLSMLEGASPGLGI